MKTKPAERHRVRCMVRAIMCRTGTCAGPGARGRGLVTGDAIVTRGCAGAGDANSGSSDNDTKRRLRSRIWADLPPKGTTLGEHNCWRRGPPYLRMTLCTGHRVAETEAPERLTTVAGWRRVGREVWEAAGVFRPIEQIPLRRTLGKRPGRHLKPGRRPASVRHVCRTTEASGHPAPGPLQPPTVRHIRRIGGRRNVQRRRRCRNRGPGRRVPRAESTSRHAVLQLQGEDGGTEDGAGLPRRAPQPLGASLLSPLSCRFCRDVTPAARFLCPIQYNAILLTP